jgi:pimeloyl-ACP methyl ester carboxylesterase
MIITGLVLRPVTGNLFDYIVWRISSKTPVQTGSVQSGNSIIHYTSMGSGRPVILLHGGLSHRLSWFSQIPMLVRSGHRVILMDTRGHGRSTAGDVAPSYFLYAEDVIQVLNRLELSCVDVIGWSDGANTAFVLAYYWPEKINDIVAISGNFSPDGLTAQALADTDVRSEGITRWFKGILTGAGERLPELEAQVKQLWSTGVILTATDLQEIHQPVLLIAGEQDQIAERHSVEMHERLPDSLLIIISNGGHATPVTDAALVNDAILEFLTRPGNQQTCKETHTE